MPTTTKFGFSQLVADTPTVAKAVANSVLYVAAIGNIAIATFTKIPQPIQADVALYSLQVTAFVNAICHMFGIQTSAPTYTPPKS